MSEFSIMAFADQYTNNNSPYCLNFILIPFLIMEHIDPLLFRCFLYWYLASRGEDLGIHWPCEACMFTHMYQSILLEKKFLKSSYRETDSNIEIKGTLQELLWLSTSWRSWLMFRGYVFNEHHKMTSSRVRDTHEYKTAMGMENNLERCISSAYSEAHVRWIQRWVLPALFKC